MYYESHKKVMMQMTPHQRAEKKACEEFVAAGGDWKYGVAIKLLREQTLMKNYVFAMVMREPKQIKPLLEYILGRKIKKIRMVEPEKTMKEKFESKGIRLDLYVEDEDGVVYDVEVQN